MVSLSCPPPKVWREGGEQGGGLFSKKVLFMMEETFLTNLCGTNLKVVHWCVDGDVTS